MSTQIAREKIPAAAIEDLSFLQGLQTQFTSVAEMITIRAQEIPHRAHVLFYDQVITYAQTNEKANRVANFLKKVGVTKGEVVSLMIMNSPEIYDCMFGAQKIGAISSSINFALKGPEITYLLEDSKPLVVFVETQFMEEFIKGYQASLHQPLIVEVSPNETPGTPQADITLAGILSAYPADESLVPQLPDDPTLLLYSSGTTGKPKGILLTNKGQLSICRDMTRLGLVKGDDRMLILLPMFHTNPICVWTYPMIFCGQTVCIRKAFSPQDFWPSIIENEISILMGVPAMYTYVYYSIDPSTIDRTRLKLNWAFSGAAPLSVDLIQGFKEKFNVDIIEGYGLTEGTGVTTANPPLGNRKPGSIGMALWEQEVAIMDDNLVLLPPGTRGEICVKGEATMLSYLNNPDATAAAIQDGWLRTGDVGYMDEDGFFYVVDRKKDLINRGGENIYPREIEAVLESHPEIAAVAVIGVPDEALGERVKAVIETSRPGVLSEEDVKEFLADKLARFKIPEFVEIMEQIPRNPTGKILKRNLR